MDFALILDIVVIAIVLISAVVAFLRGFVREVLTILGLVGASMTALTAGPKLAPGLEKWLTSDIPADDLDGAKMWGMIPYDIAAGFFAYVGLFVITLVALSLISHWIAKSVHAVGLGPVDRSLGVVFGIGRAFVLIGLLYMPFYILMEDKDKDDWFGKSHAISYVTYSSEIMMGLMPDSWSISNDDGETTEEEDGEGALDPLGDLTGENEDTQTDKTPSDAEPKTIGYDDVQRQAIDVLIENQDKIKDLIQGIPTNE
jgi:membrane protein required for colicin V production